MDNLQITDLWYELVTQYNDTYGLNISACVGSSFYIQIELFTSTENDKTTYHILSTEQKLHRCFDKSDPAIIETIMRDYLDYQLNIFANNKSIWNLTLQLDIMPEDIRIGEP